MKKSMNEIKSQLNERNQHWQVLLDRLDAAEREFQCTVKKREAAQAELNRHAQKLTADQKIYEAYCNLYEQLQQFVHTHNTKVHETYTPQSRIEDVIAAIPEIEKGKARYQTLLEQLKSKEAGATQVYENIQEFISLSNELIARRNSYDEDCKVLVEEVNHIMNIDLPAINAECESLVAQYHRLEAEQKAKQDVKPSVTVDVIVEEKHQTETELGRLKSTLVDYTKDNAKDKLKTVLKQQIYNSNEKIVEQALKSLNDSANKVSGKAKQAKLREVAKIKKTSLRAMNDAVDGIVEDAFKATSIANKVIKFASEGGEALVEMVFDEALGKSVDALGKFIAKSMPAVGSAITAHGGYLVNAFLSNDSLNEFEEDMLAKQAQLEKEMVLFSDPKNAEIRQKLQLQSGTLTDAAIAAIKANVSPSISQGY